MTSKKSPIEWTVAGLLNEIRTMHATMPDRALAFVLGSGASASSGIPTGKAMAEKWLKELHQRECLDGKEIDHWLASGALEIEGLTLDKAAEFYPQIFARRFRGDPDSGFASLEAAMDNKEPGLGYSLLAEIMQHTRHKVVVTTNFDNLVADALAIHAHKPPLIVGHESLTGYVRSLLRRPLVAKIHRDLLFSPKNDPAGVDSLGRGWQEALNRLFRHYTPLVIGYGGNDGSLMGFLDNLKPGEINGRIFWCYRAGSHPSQAVRDLLGKLDGVLVAVHGFDELMLLLAKELVEEFDMPGISSRIEERGKARAKSYRDQAELLQKNLAAAPAPSADQQAAQRAMTEMFKDSNDWWAWEMRAQAEVDPEKRDSIYRSGTEVLSKSAELAGNYAIFLHEIYKDFDAAEVQYKKAMELDQSDPNHLGNYALFLTDIRKNYDVAERLYIEALKLDPDHANNIGNYALFLETIRKDEAAADVMYKKALVLDPDDANLIGNYALFLQTIRKDYDAAETLYKKALALDSEHAIHTGSYALFLQTIRKDYAAAEALYKKALELAPNHANHYANYAVLELLLGHWEAARSHAQRAVNASGDIATQEAAEALLSLALCNSLEGKSAEVELGRLKSLLQAGLQRGSWSFDDLFAKTLPDLPADVRALYEALGAAILDEQALPALEQNEHWQQIEARPWSEQ